MSHRNKLLLSCIVFCFLSFLFLDFSQSRHFFLSSFLKYLSIFFIFFLTFPEKNSLPLFLTLVCDWLLLFTIYHRYGIALFCLVHLLYLHLLLPCHKKRQSLFLTLYLFPILLYLPFLAVCSFYAFSFLLHIIAAVFSYQKYPSVQKKGYLFGLLLFVLCDICVALSNFTGRPLFTHMIWLFYTPSQLFMALRFLEKKHENYFIQQQ